MSYNQTPLHKTSPHKTPHHTISFRKVTTLTLGVLLLGGGVAWFVRSQVVQLKRIQVQVESGFWSEDLGESVKSSVVQKVKPFKGKFIGSFSLKEVSDVVRSEPRVREVFVQRRLPNLLKLKVELHQPLVLLMGLKGELLPVARDASLFPPMGETADLPVLRGINFHREKNLIKQAVEMLEEISVTGLDVRNQISEIRFDKKLGYVLYLLSDGVRIHLGQGDYGEKVKRVERVMSYLENQKMKYSVIDARFSKKVVVKPRKEFRLIVRVQPLQVEIGGNPDTGPV